MFKWFLKSRFVFVKRCWWSTSWTAKSLKTSCVKFCCLRLESAFRVPSTLFEIGIQNHQLCHCDFDIDRFETWTPPESAGGSHIKVIEVLRGNFQKETHGNAFSHQKSACFLFFLNPSLMWNDAKPRKKNTHPTYTYIRPATHGFFFLQTGLVEATYPKFRVIPGKEAAKAVTWALWGPKYSRASFFAAMR